MGKVIKSHFYVGTQVDRPNDGIYGLWLDEDTGALSQAGIAAAIERPTWLLRHPQLNVLYTVSEVGNRDAREGRLHAFRIGEDGALATINDVPAGGGGPTHLEIDREGLALFSANFGGGQAVCAPLAPDGTLASNISIRKHEGSGPHRRQKSPHPHGVTLDPTGRFLLVPDMGADRIFIHRFDAENVGFVDNQTQEVELPAGSGPRLTLFGLGGRHVYLLSELSAEIFVFEWNGGEGTMEPVQTLALDDVGGDGDPSAAAFVMSEDGRFLYASNRRTHAIQAYAISESDGRLRHIQTIACGGEKPWSAAISPSGSWFLVTNQASDNVAVFKRDEESGMLESVEGATAQIPTPTCVAFSGLRGQLLAGADV